MAYSGYLVKVGEYTIPLSYIRAETYKVFLSTLDLDSTRLQNGELQREVLAHKVGKIEFETPPLKTNSEINTLMSSIRSNYINALEKSCNVTFYVPELDDYVTQKMYIPDITFEMYYADNSIIKYEPIRLAFIGY